MNITGTNTGKYVADSYTEANSGAEYLGSKGDVIEAKTYSPSTSSVYPKYACVAIIS